MTFMPQFLSGKRTKSNSSVPALRRSVQYLHSAARSVPALRRSVQSPQALQIASNRAQQEQEGKREWERERGRRNCDPDLIERRRGAHWVMATQISVIPYHAESIFLPSSSCPRPRFLVVHLPKTCLDCDKRLYRHLCFVCLDAPSINNFRRAGWSIRGMVDDSRSDPPGSGVNNGTRLARAIQSFQAKLSTRVAELKKGLSMKVLFFLVGFYCATAFATVIGQTGDWDILSAGLAVVVVEGIGALMYRASLPLLGRIRSLITVFNYWKAGLALGLFLDAFKYEMEMVLGSWKPLGIEIDLFPFFW